MKRKKSNHAAQSTKKIPSLCLHILQKLSFYDKTFPGGPYFVICQFVEPHRKKVRAFYDEINLSLLL